MATEIEHNTARHWLGDASDAELVMLFTRRGDEEAFRQLVERHYALVMGVCRNILRSSQDAEDAFQATFLILARRCPSIRQLNSLAGWLQRVAYRNAIRLAKQKSRRGEVSLTATEDLLETPSLGESSLRIIHDVETMHCFYEELDRLPDKLRNALVLFYLEGMPRRKAAHALDCTDSALKGRLAQGRRLLRQRLLRRGVALSIAAHLVFEGHQQQAMANSSTVADATTAMASRFRRASADTSASSSNSLTIANQGIQEMIRTSLFQPGLAATTAICFIAIAAGVRGSDSFHSANETNDVVVDVTTPVELQVAPVRTTPKTARMSLVASQPEKGQRNAGLAPVEQEVKEERNENVFVVSAPGTEPNKTQRKKKLTHQARMLELQIATASMELKTATLKHKILQAENEAEQHKLEKQAAETQWRVTQLHHEMKTVELEYQLAQVRAEIEELSKPQARVSVDWVQAVPSPKRVKREVRQEVKQDVVKVRAENTWRPITSPRAHPVKQVQPFPEPGNGQIQPGSTVHVEAILGDVLDARTIVDGRFLVDRAGNVALGAAIGRIKIGGMPCEEAEQVLQRQLSESYEGVKVQITIPTPTPSISPFPATTAPQR